jgi:hypothetical protein
MSRDAMRGGTDAQAMALAFAAVRDPASLAGIAPAQLDLTLRVMRRLRLLGRVAWQLDSRGLLRNFPPIVIEQLRSALVLAEARSRLLRWELVQLANCLQPATHGPVVVLKGGAYLLLDLPNARGRLPSDVDLLVHEQALPAHEARLQESGWRSSPLSAYDDRYYREWTHEIPPLKHVEREVEIDLHHNILQRTARLKPDASLLLAAAKPAAHGLAVLAPVDMTLHAMTHLFYSSEQHEALRELADIAGLLEHFGPSVSDFWRELPGRARQLDLVRPAAYALRYCARLLDTTIPDEVQREFAPHAPPPWVLRAMDWCVPRALVVPHPDGAGSAGAIARVLLQIRAHWVRMPPGLLARHLGYKVLLEGRRRIARA